MTILIIILIFFYRYLDTNTLTLNGTRPANYTRIKKKSVVIINKMSPDALRNVKKKKGGKGAKGKNKKVETLLYVEYGADKQRIYDYMMRNLEDVSNFFAGFLNIEVCMNYCPQEDND